MERTIRFFRMLLVWLLLAPAPALAEPIAFEQAANVTGKGGIELGAAASYAWGDFEEQGVGTTVEKSIFEVPMFVRLGISAIEGRVRVPYGNVKSNVNSESGEVNYSGIRDVEVMLKFWLIQSRVFNLSAGADSTFPTAEPSKYLGQGLALQPFAALGLDFRVLRLHGKVGYQFNASSTTTTDPVTNEPVDNVSLEPGDGFDWAAGVEVPFAGVFSAHAELLGKSFSELRFDGGLLPDTAGATMAFVPGLRLTALPFKAKLGLSIPVKNENNQTTASPRSQWTVLAGVSLQFSAGGPNTNTEQSVSSINSGN